MKSQIASLCGLASLASGLTTRPSMFARQEAASCIDCTIPLIANSDFANGVVADGDYYHPTKTGNWLLANSVGGVGDLSVVQDPQGNHLRNFCAKDHIGYCQVYLAQLVTVQAGVSYDFRAQYAMSNVRETVNRVTFQIDTSTRGTRYFQQFISAGNTDWTTFGSNAWVSPVSGDIIFTVFWRNDPNDAVVKLRSVKFEAVECRIPDSPFNCANQKTSTTAQATTSTTAAATTTTSDTTMTTSDTTTSTTDSTTTSDTTTSTTDSTSTTATSTTTTAASTTTTTSATSTTHSTTAPTRTRRPGKCGRKTRTRQTASTTSDIASSTTEAASTTESETVAPTTTSTTAPASSSTLVQSMTVY